MIWIKVKIIITKGKIIIKIRKTITKNKFEYLYNLTLILHFKIIKNLIIDH